jgi:hypothetical protein
MLPVALNFFALLSVFYMLDTARVNGATVQQLKLNSTPLPEGKDKHPKVNQVCVLFVTKGSL